MYSLAQKNHNASRARAQKYAAQRAASSARMSSGVTPYSGVQWSYQGGDDSRYYSAFRDIAYTAIRPIATRFAGQPLKVAAVPISAYSTSMDSAQSRMTKALHSHGLISSKWEQKQKAFRDRMPLQIKESLPENSVVLEAHPFLDTIGRPNDIMDGWSTLYCVAASLMTCGKALLTWDEVNQSTGSYGSPTSSVFYIPMHWATPNHADTPFSGWTIRPTHGGQSVPVDRGQFIYFQMPNPKDPLDGYSPMMASARTINTSDKISDAHQASMQNLISPSYAVVAGDVVSNGDRRRARFSKDQRKEITNAIKSYIGGVMRSGEPIILDALIDDIKDISPKNSDLGFIQGADMTMQRIMQAYGVSNVIAGYAENANRAGATTAHEVFYDLVLNPLLLLSGGAFTHFIGPKYNTPAYRIVIYHEPATIEDADMKRARAALFKESFSDVEKRKYVRTGQVDWTDEDVPPRPEPAGNPVSLN